MTGLGWDHSRKLRAQFEKGDVKNIDGVKKTVDVNAELAASEGEEAPRKLAKQFAAMFEKGETSNAIVQTTTKDQAGGYQNDDKAPGMNLKTAFEKGDVRNAEVKDKTINGEVGHWNDPDRAGSKVLRQKLVAGELSNAEKKGNTVNLEEDLEGHEASEIQARRTQFKTGTVQGVETRKMINDEESNFRDASNVQAVLEQGVKSNAIVQPKLRDVVDSDLKQVEGRHGELERRTMDGKMSNTTIAPKFVDSEDLYGNKY